MTLGDWCEALSGERGGSMFALQGLVEGVLGPTDPDSLTPLSTADVERLRAALLALSTSLEVAAERSPRPMVAVPRKRKRGRK